MPLPDTDEMIQARWGKKQWDFYKWHNNNEKELRGTMKIDAPWNALDLLLQRRWPSKQDRKDYYAWSREWNGRFMLRMSYKWSPQEFIDKVLQTNFLDAAACVDLWWAMDTYNLGSIPMGHTKFAGVESYYAFKPEHSFIQPDRNESGPSVLGKSILAMTVHFTRPRTVSIASASTGTFDSSSSGSKVSSIFSRPEKSARVRASTGSEEQADPLEVARNEIDPNHFVFAQLGMLYVYGGDYENAKGWGLQVIKQGPWWRNDLVVVVKLDHEGNPGAVYVLYHPNSCVPVADHDDGEELAPEAKYHTPGLLHPGCKGGFFLAKVADSLKEFGNINKEFRFLLITNNISTIHRAQLFEHSERGLIVGPALAMVKRKA